MASVSILLLNSCFIVIVVVANCIIYSKYIDIYGNINELKRCLSEAGLSFTVEDKAETNIDWWQRYTERYQVARDVDHDEAADEQQAQDTIDRVREQLLQFQSSGNIDILQQSAEILLDLLGKWINISLVYNTDCHNLIDLFPQSDECYHLLAFIPALTII
jgi:hypothetical protein